MTNLVLFWILINLDLLWLSNRMVYDLNKSWIYEDIQFMKKELINLNESKIRNVVIIDPLHCIIKT